MTIRELSSKTTKKLIIISLSTGIALYILDWFFKFINYSGYYSELKGDALEKSLAFIGSYLSIAYISFIFYESYLEEIIENVEESWFKKVIEERDWLNHKELFSLRKTVTVCRTITLCLFLIQILIAIFLRKILGNGGFATEYFIIFSILFFFYFLWQSRKLVLKSAKRVKSKTLFLKWEKLYDFFYENKKISDNYYSKLSSEYDHLSHLRSKMQDFETIEIDTKLSKVKFLLLEIQDHLEEFKNERVQFIISGIPEKVRRFYRGDTDTKFGNDFTPKFIALNDYRNTHLKCLYLSIKHKNIDESDRI